VSSSVGVSVGGVVQHVRSRCPHSGVWALYDLVKTRLEMLTKYYTNVRLSVAYSTQGRDTENDLSVRPRRVFGTIKSPWVAERRRLTINTTVAQFQRISWCSLALPGVIQPGCRDA